MNREFFDRMMGLVRDAHPERDAETTGRRLLKLFEEIGELSQAYLSATSTTSQKGKTWADVEEEAADCFVVTADIALTHEGEIPDRLIKTAHRTVAEFDIPACIASMAANASYSLGARLFEVPPPSHRMMQNTDWSILIGAFAALMLAHKGDEAAAKASVERKLEKWAAAYHPAV